MPKRNRGKPPRSARGRELALLALALKAIIVLALIVLWLLQHGRPQ